MTELLSQDGDGASGHNDRALTNLRIFRGNDGSTVLAISRRCIVGDWQIQNSIVMLSSWWWYPNDKHGSTSIIYKCPLFKQVTGLFLVIYPLQHSIISSYSLSVLTFRNSSKPETFTNSQLQSCNLLTCSLMIYLIPLQNIVSAMPKIQTRKITNFSDFHSSFDNDDIV